MKLIIETWKKFLKEEEEDPPDATGSEEAKQLRRAYARDEYIPHGRLKKGEETPHLKFHPDEPDVEPLKLPNVTTQRDPRSGRRLTADQFMQRVKNRYLKKK